MMLIARCKEMIWIVQRIPHSFIELIPHKFITEFDV